MTTLMIWMMLLKPSFSALDFVASFRVLVDWHRLNEQLYMYRLCCMPSHPCRIDLVSLCESMLPYAHCEWVGLHDSHIGYYADFSRVSPGRLIVRGTGFCGISVISSYGLVREFLC